jgi:hypothetical protein
VSEPSLGIEQASAESLSFFPAQQDDRGVECGDLRCDEG